MVKHSLSTFLLYKQDNFKKKLAFLQAYLVNVQHNELPDDMYIYWVPGADPGFEFRGALIELNDMQSKAKNIMG